MRGLQVLAIGCLCAATIGLAPSLMAAPESGGWQALVEGYNDTGQRLFRLLAKEPGNIVLSPYSIGTTMAMALAGAGGENAAEMARVLDLGLSRDELGDAHVGVLGHLDGAKTIELRTADGLVLKQGALISPEYIKMLRKNYAADVFHGADAATINEWVRKKTGGKIDSIFNSVDPTTALVLLDAIYFKAAWEEAFDPNATHPDAFHLAGGDADVPTMHKQAYFPVVEQPGFRAIRLRYTGERLSMIVILPDAGVDDALQTLDGAAMRSLMTAVLTMAPRPVDLSLPRFKASFTANLVDPFRELGMHRAFDISTADFSGMTGKPQAQIPLAIGQIVHRAVIEVTERGTEAAGATGMGMVTTSARPKPEIFKIDRPFLFAIVNDATGAILFEGRIVDPRQPS